METKMKLISSLEKVFFDFPENVSEHLFGSMLKNEIHSFQLICEIDYMKKDQFNCHIEIESEINDFISLYKIDYVPSFLTVYPSCECEDYITKSPGLFPDSMVKIRDGKIRLVRYLPTAVWVCVEPDSKVSGIYPITLKLYDEENNLLGKATYTLKIIDAQLLKQEMKSTCWFHGDCIAKLHNVEIQSDEYFEIAEKYIEIYAKFGHNMILTPIFTPPIDTDVGAERLTNQLVGVKKTENGYEFDFSTLKKWIDVCSKYGIEYFEIAHLFTQWGAGYTPKIMADKDGENTRIFGWDIEATSKEYTLFLDVFLPKLISFLKAEGIYEKCMFHISDEPTEAQAAQYANALAIVEKHIEKDKIMDAISEYAFYKKGLINNPVVCNDHIKPFLEHNTKNLWTYYCCLQDNKVSNRFMAMPSYRNRILGCQLYKYNIKGFLQWGFNFWFSQRSRFVIDPYHITDADMAFPSGDAFVVYPLDKHNEVVTSLRLYVFNEAMQDMRALYMLELLASRQEVEKMLNEITGFDEYPRNAEFILSLRQEVNDKIEALTKNK